MASTQIMRTSFGGGIVSPELFGRVDYTKEQSGLEDAVNCIVTPYGSIQNRAGTLFVSEAKAKDKRCRLIPFIYNNEQSFAVEFGDGTIQFHTPSGSLLENLITNGGFASSLDGWSGSDTLEWSKGKVKINYASKVASALTNGSFAVSLSGWSQTVTGVLSSVTRKKIGDFDGKAQLTKGIASDTCRLYRATTAPSGKQYVLAFTVHAAKGQTMRVGVGSSSTSYTMLDAAYADGKYEIEIPDLGITNFVVTFRGTVGSGTAAVSDVSVRSKLATLRTWVAVDADKDYTLSTAAQYISGSTHHVVVYEAATDSDVSGSPLTGAINVANGESSGAFTTASAPYVRIEYTAERMYLSSAYLASSGNGVLLSLASPYKEKDLQGISTAQSGDIMTICHPDYPPYELQRYSNADWILTQIPFAPKIQPPAVAPAVAVTGSGTVEYEYVFTVLDATTLEESDPSPSTVVTNNLTVTGNKNTLTMTYGGPVSRYNVYRRANGVYGYIGQTAATTFKDNNILPDLTKVIGQRDTIFSTDSNYPSCAAYFEQRRWFASSKNQPQNVWSSAAGNYSNTTYHIPPQDSDALRFALAAQGATQIRHLVPLNDLVMLTSTAEYKMENQTTGISGISIKPQSTNGSSRVPPIPSYNGCLFVQSQTNHIRELTLNQLGSFYESADVSLLAKHLFDGKEVVDMALARTPHQTLWVLMDDGGLYSLTYLPEQEIQAWTRHELTGGVVESICVIPTNTADRLMLAVRSTVGGVVGRYIETLAVRDTSSLDAGHFVDFGVDYTSPTPLTVWPIGAKHLHGSPVAATVDGVETIVSVDVNGTVTTSNVGYRLHVGIPINSYFLTTPLALTTIAAAGQSANMNISKMWLRVVDFTGVTAGPSEANKEKIKAKKLNIYGNPDFFTGEVAVRVGSAWNGDARLFVQQQSPLPMTVAFLAAEVSIGGN